MDENESEIKEAIEYMKKNYGMDEKEARYQIRQTTELNRIAYLVGNFILKEITTSSKLINISSTRFYESINYVVEKMKEDSQVLETQIKSVSSMTKEEMDRLINKPTWER